RFEHSLGVFGTTQWFVTSLLGRSAFRDAATREDLMTVLAAGLLHDLGHYPFAHSLEALHLKGRQTPTHEEVGGQIMAGELEGLRGEEPIGALLRRDWGVDHERVMRLCTGELGAEATQMDRVLKTIISGAIDADKMDYLERDSHHMGVPYGRHYDRQRLLASLTLNGAEDGIAIEAKGKVSAEMFIFSRYTMFSEAYWHHTVRAASAMVERALEAFLSRSEYSPQEQLGFLLAHDDDRLLEWLCDQTPPSSATNHLLRGMTRNRRRLYKRVVTLSRVYVDPEKLDAYDRIYRMDASAYHSLTANLRIAISSALGQTLHPADLILDTPPRDKDKLETIDVLFPGARGTGSANYAPLHELSKIVAGIQNDFIRVVKKIRVFASARVAEHIKALPNIEELVLDEVRRAG
ncbi:MAG: HD domain-containing protein, partial [Myxococcota bacterium]